VVTADDNSMTDIGFEMIGICKRSIGEVMKDGGKVGRSGLTIL
jgi:hypothetical protein